MPSPRRTPGEEVNHRFDQALRPYGVEHLLIPPYYPEANGKIEAFIKTLSHEALVLLADQAETPQPRRTPGWGLPDLGCPEWTGWAEPPLSPVKALILSG